MIKLFRLSLLLSALVATPALAQAAEPVQNRIVVSTADLNLSSATGQRVLDRRLSHAVVEACGIASTVDLAGKNEVRRCRDDTAKSIAADRDRLVELASEATDIILAAR